VLSRSHLDPPHPRQTRLAAGVTAGVVAASSAVVAASVAPTGAGAATVAKLKHTVVVAYLNNPRQLDLVHGDALLIAEAGRGGTVKVVNDPEGGKQGIGYTGSISLVLSPAKASRQKPHRIIGGLVSVAAAEADGPGSPKGGFATGADGVAARTLNQIAIQETDFSPGAPLPARAAAQSGKLLIGVPHESIKPKADITAYETAHDPDRKGVESNPYAVINYRGGWLVADAAANAVLRVSRTGVVSLFRTFPNIKSGSCAKETDPTPAFPGCNFVPTSLVADSRNNVYVGGLSSLHPGEAKVWKLNPNGKVIARWGGFTSVTGLALGRDGSLYVSQLFAAPLPGADFPGVLTRIKGKTRTHTAVPFPAGVAVDAANRVYVSAFSVFPGSGGGIPNQNTSGQVWRLKF